MPKDSAAPELQIIVERHTLRNVGTTTEEGGKELGIEMAAKKRLF